MAGFAGMVLGVQRYFSDKKELAWFLNERMQVVCPRCGATGTFVRHGYIRGAVSPTEYGIRGWRIFCDPDSPRGRGCGWAPALWLSRTILHRCFTAEQLLVFIFALIAGLSVRAAWRRSGIGLSLVTAYRLHKRLDECQSVLRTRLSSRDPPAKNTESAGTPLLQVLTLLQETLGSVAAYQEELQRDFLAVA